MYFDNEDNEILPFYGMILKVVNEGYSTPLLARLINIGPQFLTFERRDGTRVLIKRRKIESMVPVLNQHPEAV